MKGIKSTARTGIILLAFAAVAMAEAAIASETTSYSYDAKGRLVVREIAAQASAREHLAIAPPAGMSSRTDADGMRRSIDWFTPGQKADEARRRVTIEGISGLAGPGAPAEMLRGLAICLGPCTEKVSPVDTTPFAGRPAARIRIDEPLNARTGKPMTIFALAVSGERDLHIITIVIRGDLSPADEAFVPAVFRSATWCPAGSSEGICGSP